MIVSTRKSTQPVKTLYPHYTRTSTLDSQNETSQKIDSSEPWRDCDSQQRIKGCRHVSEVLPAVLAQIQAGLRKEAA